MRSLIFGPPGAGKGTIAKEISKEFNLQHISTGDLIRKEIATGSELGKEMESIISKGNLLSDELMIKVLKSQLPEDNFMLDGYPRNLAQAKQLSDITDVDKAIFLTVPDEEVIDRIVKRTQCSKCGKIYGRDFPPKDAKVCDLCGEEVIKRTDDNETTVKHRLNIYKSETEPVLEFYKEKLVEINANQPVEKVVEETRKALQW